MDDQNPIRVGVAAYDVTTGERPLRTSGVCSCVVVALVDEVAGVSGLLHFMIPRAEGEAGTDEHPAAKFADPGIEAMCEAFESRGGRPDRAWAKLAGGASMLEFANVDRPIGERNVEAAREELDARGIPVRASDVGGTTGRTVTLHPETGEVTVRTADGETRRL